MWKDDPFGRGSADYALFAAGFIGFVIFFMGLTLGYAFSTAAGLLVMLLATLGFRARM